ncbi:MAG: hypothetical protein IPK73_23360 [Candidatus Obscuribacter sp.]|nr:hypothetical protein [Candidatus Obscuribacter sp.]MBK9277052.1 hypothetical protein [Candidatus Obscuribacter sp.]
MDNNSESSTSDTVKMDVGLFLDNLAINSRREQLNIYVLETMTPQIEGIDKATASSTSDQETYLTELNSILQSIEVEQTKCEQLAAQIRCMNASTEPDGEQALKDYASSIQTKIARSIDLIELCNSLQRSIALVAYPKAHIVKALQDIQLLEQECNHSLSRLTSTWPGELADSTKAGPFIRLLKEACGLSAKLSSQFEFEPERESIFNNLDAKKLKIDTLSKYTRVYTDFMLQKMLYDRLIFKHVSGCLYTFLVTNSDERREKCGVALALGGTLILADSTATDIYLPGERYPGGIELRVEPYRTQYGDIQIKTSVRVVALTSALEPPKINLPVVKIKTDNHLGKHYRIVGQDENAYLGQLFATKTGSSVTEALYDMSWKLEDGRTYFGAGICFGRWLLAKGTIRDNKLNDQHFVKLYKIDSDGHLEGVWTWISPETKEVFLERAILIS